MSHNQCIFCKIASGELQSEILYQDEKFLVIRDVNPVAPVHLLIIPKGHIESLNAVNDFAEVGEMLKLAVTFAREFNIDKAGYRIVINTGDAGGQSVKHLHIHLLGERNLGWPPG